MPYVPVPKDLTTVKTKVAFNLTKRQLICFALAAAVGLPIYFLTRNSIGSSGAVMLLVIAALPFFFFAMYEKNGLPLEKILKHYINSRFIRPQYRPYKTQNLYTELMKQNELEKEVSKIAESTPHKAKNKYKKAANPKAKAANCGSGKKSKNAR